MKSANLLTIYPKLQAADQLTKSLIAAGFPIKHIGMAVSEVYRQGTQNLVSKTTDREILVYAVRLQQILNNWGETSTHHVPGIGNVVLTGFLADTLQTSDHFEDCLKTVGVPSEQNDLILESLRRGDIIVTVQVPEKEIGMASELMCRHEPLDLKGRERQWRNRGWQGFDAMSDPFSVEEIIRKKRQYQPPRISNMSECLESVVQRYVDKTTQDT